MNLRHGTLRAGALIAASIAMLCVSAFAQTPTVTSISPTSGTSSGGTPVTITGMNFASGATVAIGTAAATSITVVNGTTITAVTPANAPGAMNVTVTNPNLQSGTLWAVQQPLTNPGFESGTTGWTVFGLGTATVLSGSGAHSGSKYAQLTVASPGTQVSYNATLNGTSQYLPVNPGDVINYGGWAYRVDTNSGDGLARWQIELTDSNQKNPTYQAATPNNVTTGSWVYQQNTYTIPATGVSYVRFWCQITGNTSAQAQANFDDAVLTRTVPGGGFTYIGTPTLTAVSPSTGLIGGGTSVTLTGTNFQNGATVTFGSNAATGVTVVSSTTITATTPAGAAGAVNVTVNNPIGPGATLTNGFTYANPAPTALSISPASGPSGGGTSVTITGTNFLSGALVTFGSTQVTPSSVTSTTITATTPADALGGAVNVVVTNPDSQTATLWAVQQPLTNPGFESGTSGWTAGGFGTVAVIDNPAQAHSGNNFAQMTVVAPNTQVDYIASLNGTSEYLPVNPGDVINYGGWTYRVDNNSGDGLARWQIEITENQAGASYQASNPNNATYGAGWTMQQNTYTVPTGKNMVRFWCQISSTSGTVTAEANCDDAFFTRTVPGGGFTYIVPAPTVISISPTSGPIAGGTSTTITGTNFLTGATVMFGSNAATGVTVLSSTTITATTPAGPAGPVNVVVTNPGGLFGTLTNGFTFVGPAPTISYIAPVSGTINGGTSLNLHGTNFEQGATVTIGGVPLNITFVGSTLIQGTTSAHLAGGADVVVTNVDQQTAALAATLYNQGFELGNTRWVSTGKGTVTIVNCSSSGCSGNVNNAHNGTYYAEASSPVAGNQPTLYVADSTGKALYFPVTPGDVITFGGWAYRVSGDGKARWGIEITDSNKANPNYVSAPPADVQEPMWELQQGTYTVPSGKAFVRLYCQITGNTVAAVARFDDAILQRSPEGTYGYTYMSTPWVNTMSPNWGAPAGGTTRTVYGTGFQNGSTVSVGGAAGTNVVVNNNNAITFFVPAHAAGAVSVVVTGPDGQPSNTVTNAYTYEVPPAPPTGWTAIHHIIYTLQENRSFDQNFGQMHASGVGIGTGYYAFLGVPGTTVNVTPTNTQIKDIAGVEIAPFHSPTECVENTQPSWNAQHIDYDNGLMDDFMLTGNMFTTSSTIDPNGTRTIGYFDWTDLPFYYSLAYQFATSDSWFSSTMANTGANRSYVVAATSLGSVGTPTPPSGGLPNMTIFDLLDQAGISWRYYYQNATPIWIQTWSTYNKNINPATGFNQNIVPIANFKSDLQDESTFPQVVFIEESGANDEHPKPNPGVTGLTESIQSGENLTAGYIEDLLTSPTWSSSVLIFTYDEAGGVYDHVAPPTNQAIPDGYPPSINLGSDQPGLFNQFGMRVPLMVVSPWTGSPWATPATPQAPLVSHTVRDHTSILKFIETRFSLPPLTARDAAADNMAEFFNFTSPPWTTPPSASATCDPGTTQCLVYPPPTNGVCNLSIEAAPGH